MSYNIDGFNERNTFIRNSNDKNRIGSSKFDNSFAKMRSEERHNNVVTTNRDNIQVLSETRGNKENFIVRNSRINNVNKSLNKGNYVSRAMNNNMFKRPN